MVIAGLSGGLDRSRENRFGVTPYAFHDSACVLLDGGDVAAAIEEERLTRIKHTNKAPLHALRACLAARGLSFGDVDAFAFAVRESYLDAVVAGRYARARSIGRQRGRQFLQALFDEELGARPDTRRFEFVAHHFAHACSAYYPSGFEHALILTLDGVGDGLSGSIYAATSNRLELLRTFPEEESLGFFYVRVTRYLGLDLFDEYKVMGLAPYGDGARYAPIFDALYTLLPDGGYRFDQRRLRELSSRLPKRTPGADFTQRDKDVAMAAQLTLQRIVAHVASTYRRTTGLDRLCLAGGVALNCSMNGALLRSGCFRDIFVQPAAHDAGLALGAALHVQHRAAPRRPCAPRLRHLFWGGDCGSASEIEALLQRWDAFIAVERVDDAADAAARLLSEGTILGWAQGRSEFGPRALGHRSILADPRPAANKDVINALVKKREAFRPFAPSVLEEYAAELFDLPPGTASLPFMLFTVPVREPYRALLGAVTHVDGSARVQTVSQADNPQYWRLIDRFRARTGVPVLLNTSFNNYAEPIVETALDALVCLLTTGLPVLMLERWIVRKKPRTVEAMLQLKPRLPPYAKLHDVAAPHAGNGASHLGGWWHRLTRAPRAPRWLTPRPAPATLIGTTFNSREFSVPPDLFRALLASDGHQTLGALLDDARVIEPGARALALAAIDELWERRLVVLTP